MMLEFEIPSFFLKTLYIFNIKIEKVNNLFSEIIKNIFATINK